jgi:hypothetical protein
LSALGYLLNLTLDRVAHSLTRSVIVVVVPRPKKAFQPITAFSGYDVYMQVRHCLANAIVNCYERSFGIHRGLDSFR